MPGLRASRDEWLKRVERWKESGPTAKEFADETGINAGTLQFWRYTLRSLGSEHFRAEPATRGRRTEELALRRQRRRRGGQRHHRVAAGQLQPAQDRAL